MWERSFRHYIEICRKICTYTSSTQAKRSEGKASEAKAKASEAKAKDSFKGNEEKTRGI